MNPVGDGASRRRRQGRVPLLLAAIAVGQWNGTPGPRPKTGPLPIRKLRVMLRDCIGTPPYRLKGRAPALPVCRPGRQFAAGPGGNSDRASGCGGDDEPANAKIHHGITSPCPALLGAQRTGLVLLFSHRRTNPRSALAFAARWQVFELTTSGSSAVS